MRNTRPEHNASHSDTPLIFGMICAIGSHGVALNRWRDRAECIPARTDAILAGVRRHRCVGSLFHSGEIARFHGEQRQILRALDRRGIGPRENHALRAREAGNRGQLGCMVVVVNRVEFVLLAVHERREDDVGVELLPAGPGATRLTADARHEGAERAVRVTHRRGPVERRVHLRFAGLQPPRDFLKDSLEVVSDDLVDDEILRQLHVGPTIQRQIVHHESLCGNKAGDRDDVELVLLVVPRVVTGLLSSHRIAEDEEVAGTSPASRRPARPRPSRRQGRARPAGRELPVDVVCSCALPFCPSGYGRGFGLNGEMSSSSRHTTRFLKRQPCGVLTSVSS